MADLLRPAPGTARLKPACQDAVFDVSKVTSNSSAGAPALDQSSHPIDQGNRKVIDQF
jgi:hypothetical protein